MWFETFTATVSNENFLDDEPCQESVSDISETFFASIIRGR
jgi:hypothetical protein